VKKLRVFAGPNGSGKSTIVQIVKGEGIQLGVYCNADDYKITINKTHTFDFDSYKLNLYEDNFLKSLKGSLLFTKMRGGELLTKISFKDNKIIFSEDYSVNDYFTSFLVSYILSNLIGQCEKFSFETVMSHSSKLEFMQIAKDNGYKVYLYFISLADPKLNIGRVATRVQSGGHYVPTDKVESRYYRSMENLLPAIRIADNSYIFDNSYEEPKMIATVINNEINISSTTIPLWFKTYVLEKLS
jgi:predicted ABC-type ATPase